MRNTTVPETAGTDQAWRLLRRYAYADRSFHDVWPLLVEAPEVVLGDEHGTGPDLPRLHVTLAGVEVSREVRLSHGGVVVDDQNARVALRWEDARHPHLFPRLTADLTLVPMTAGRSHITQVGLVARYRPPFGAIGNAADRLAGADIAAESISGYVAGVARRLEALAPPATRHPEPVVAVPDTRDLRRILIPVDHLDDRPGGGAGIECELAMTAGILQAEVNPFSGMALVEYDPELCNLTKILVTIGADAPVPETTPV